MRNILVLITIIFLCNLAFAEDGEPIIRYNLLFNGDIRHSEENFLSSKIDVLVEKNLDIKGNSWPVRIMPSLEVRHNIERNRNERISLGAEFGVDILPLLYVGEEFKYSWRNEAIYHGEQYVDGQTTEAITHLLFSSDLLSIFDKRIGWYFGNELVYDFKDGRATRNLLIAGLEVPIFDDLTAKIGWRHRDRIHYYDCDTLEGAITYSY